MEEWTKTFSNNTELGIMEQAYMRLKSQSEPGGGASSQSVPSETTPATVSHVRALYDFQPSEPGELQFRGDVVVIAVMGMTGTGKSSFIQKLTGTEGAIIGDGLASCRSCLLCP